ncbi:hypothetical protein OKA04_23290 [Luteolibacter flavescens]|uniref:Uncharacterized protein n=1 Tax=Luteolibacter flavescens TaxID=1859460 RepID=A0ABT3FVR5_9BACT|nr:hypothetical protein [Luteolibacter flavescens]MCW1887681.1 hypothetical protein [Luteolibacter flavescens]
MKARRPVSTVRDYRPPPEAGEVPTTGAPMPRAKATAKGATRGGSLSPLQMLRQGMALPEPERTDMRWFVSQYPDAYLADAYRDLSTKNLSDLTDHWVREQAERLKAVRVEIRVRGLTPKTLLEAHPRKPMKPHPLNPRR